jgi:hypothetical protein
MKKINIKAVIFYCPYCKQDARDDNPALDGYERDNESLMETESGVYGYVQCPECLKTFEIEG